MTNDSAAQSAGDDFPAWYSEEPLVLNARMILKFLTPEGSWRWTASEFEGETGFFTDLIGLEIELWCLAEDEVQYLKSKTGKPDECETFLVFQSVKDLMDDR